MSTWRALRINEARANFLKERIIAVADGAMVDESYSIDIVLCRIIACSSY